MQLPVWARRWSEKDLSDLTLAAALIAHFVAINGLPSLAWADEIFQTLEQGHRMAFGYGVVPWEFRDGIRSWVLPGMLGAVMRATEFLGAGSKGYLLGIKIFLSVCSCIPVMVAMAWARKEKLPQPWIAGLATAGWFELIFFSSKALTEVFAAYTISVALYLTVTAREDNRFRTALFAGLAWGLTVGFRLHLAPVALFAFAWACRQQWSRWKPMLLGSGGVIVGFGLLDWATWSYPFQSFILNFWVNVVKGKAAWFGVSPPYEYVASMVTVWGWTTAVLLVLAFGTFRKWPILFWSAVLILVAHSAIGHKEYRFLAPCLVIVVISAGIGLARLLQTRRSAGLVACAAFIVASAEGAWRYDWNDLAPMAPMGSDPISLWSFRDGSVQSFEALSLDDSVCGLASIGMGWGWSGGYTYLHKNVPLFDIRTDAELLKYGPVANTLVASIANGPNIGAYVRSVCWGTATEVCKYQRPGPCADPGDYTINSWLAAEGR